MPKNIKGKVMFTVEDLIPVINANGIVDCTKGGLILGNSHSDGGIKVIRHYKKDLYEWVFEFEGYEYIMHPDATAEQINYLSKINNEFQNVSNIEFEEYEIPENITLLDTRPIFKNIKETNRFLITGHRDQFIINRHTTKKYLKEIEKLNIQYC